MFDYDPMTQYNAECLNRIPNFKEKFLDQSNGQSPEVIMNMIQDSYDNHEWPLEVSAIFDNSPFDGYVFQSINVEEFMEYCALKYNVTWREEVRYWLWI